MNEFERKLSLRISLQFHSAFADLEPQIYVNAELYGSLDFLNEF